MTMFIILCVVGYGVCQGVKFVKNNPAQALQGASWLKRIISK